VDRAPQISAVGGALRRTAWWWLPTLVGAALILPALGRIPGLHADEAWSLFRVTELQNGARPLDGMTFYTGALYQYLAWPFISIFGLTAGALRAVGALGALLGIWLVGVSLRPWLGERVVLLLGLTLATSPAVVSLARFGVEIAALTPPLTALALFGFSYAARSPIRARSVLASVGGGVALGLAAYSHLLSSALPVALGLGLIVAYRGALLRRVEVWAAVGGIVLGLIPRLIGVAAAGGLGAFLSPAGQAPDSVPDLPALPGLLLGGWDGGRVYQRFAGVSAGAWPYPLVALVALAVLRRRAGVSARPTRATAAALGTLALAVVLANMLAIRLALRYFIVPLWALPVLLAWFARALVDHPLVYYRRRATALLLAVAALNVVYLGVDYFAPFVRHGGGLSVFRMGTRVLETSDHFVRTDDLFAALRARGIRRLYANAFIVMPLRIHDAAHTIEMTIWPQPSPPGDRAALDTPTALVFYNGPSPQAGEEDARRFGERFVVGQILYERAPGFPPVFRVYVARAANPP
jgi:hypothetical protein